METIVLKLDSQKLDNPDLDIIYCLPKRLEEYSNMKIKDNGYDFLTDTEIGIWLETDNSEEMYPCIIELLQKEQFCNNDLSNSVEIFISLQNCAEIAKCRKVYPVES